jgi:hypothetical protein
MEVALLDKDNRIGTGRRAPNIVLLKTGQLLDGLAARDVDEELTVFVRSEVK